MCALYIRWMLKGRGVQRSRYYQTVYSRFASHSEYDVEYIGIKELLVRKTRVEGNEPLKCALCESRSLVVNGRSDVPRFEKVYASRLNASMTWTLVWYMVYMHMQDLNYF